MCQGLCTTVDFVKEGKNKKKRVSYNVWPHLELNS